ncbi:serine/threonine-protein kinase [Streptomyces sp. NPDC004031]
MGTDRVVAERYRLGARLGRGGMGTVWAATDELLHRTVAVKELHLADGEQRALREARGLARIRHPNVVVVYDVVEQDGRPWIVMELVDGRSLAEVLREDGPLPPREAARVGAAVAGALLAAHERGIQHRDVKPANVLLDRTTGRVVLTDFGIARVPGSDTVSETGAFVGSPEYTAPERMDPNQAAGPESDLWSLGALLCAAVEGHSPFRGESVAEIVHAVAFADIRPPEAVGPLLPVVRGLLERDPARRMAAADVRTVLVAYAEAGIEPPTPPTVPRAVPEPGPGRGRKGRRRRLLAGLAAAVLIAVVAGGTAAVVVLRGRDGGGAAPSPAVTTQAPATTTAAPRPTPTASPLPAGFRTVADPHGWSVALPDGWDRQEVPPRVYYWSADHAFRFGERIQPPGKGTAYDVMHGQDVQARGAKGPYRGYRDGVVTRTAQQGADAALWEFTYDGFGDGKGARRTFDLCWVQDGRMYDVWLSGPLDRTEETRALFDTARRTFTP